MIDILDLFQQYFWAPISCAIIFQVIGRIIPIPDLWIWTGAPLIGWVFFLIIRMALYPTNKMRVALRIDITLGLKERISTALAFVNNMNDTNAARIIAQRLDAISVSRQIQPVRDFPIEWRKQHILLGSALSIIMIGLLFIPNRMDQLIAQRESITEAAQEQAELVEELSEEILKNEALSEETREALIDQLNELAEALRNNPGDLEQALADISRIQENLKTLSNPNSQALLANLESLAAKLNALTRRQPEPGQEIQSAADALGEIPQALNSLSQQELGDLAAEVARMAAMSSQAGDMELAQALSALSQAIQSGDQQAAQSAAQQAQASLSQSAQSQLDQQSIQQAISELESSSQTLAQSGQSSAQNQSTAGQAQNAGQQSNQPGNLPGQTIGGGGSQANTLPPANSAGRAENPEGIAAPAAQGQLDSQVFAPWQSSEGNGDQLYIPGQETNQGNSQSSEGQGQSPGLTNSALIPYSQVYYAYMQALNQAINQVYIPADLESFVQAYFTQLEP